MVKQNEGHDHKKNIKCAKQIKYAIQGGCCWQNHSNWEGAHWSPMEIKTDYPIQYNI